MCHLLCTTTRRSPPYNTRPRRGVAATLASRPRATAHDRGFSAGDAWLRELLPRPSLAICRVILEEALGILQERLVVPQLPVAASESPEDLDFKLKLDSSLALAAGQRLGPSIRSLIPVVLLLQLPGPLHPASSVEVLLSVDVSLVLFGRLTWLLEHHLIAFHRLYLLRGWIQDPNRLQGQWVEEGAIQVHYALLAAHFDHGDLNGLCHLSLRVPNANSFSGVLVNEHVVRAQQIGLAIFLNHGD
mmetsp:Transcript_55013/g.141616  ORF Transcript_55013/g.141616 Transcript_55013/m.141616 type:complete len:245 (-) Transcript_55013:1581-2315(-)